MAESDKQSDRRVNIELREIFVVAYEVIEPFFDPKNSWGGSTHEHLAYRTVHERFPELTGEEVLLIIAAAKGLFVSGSKRASP